MIPLHTLFKLVTKKRRKVTELHDLNMTHVSLNGEGQVGVGGTVGKKEEKIIWEDRKWWKKFKQKVKR